MLEAREEIDTRVSTDPEKQKEQEAQKERDIKHIQGMLDYRIGQRRKRADRKANVRAGLIAPPGGSKGKDEGSAHRAAAPKELESKSE